MPSFPGETAEYRHARDELLQSEIELRRQVEAVNTQRRALPLGGRVPSDYEFDQWDPTAGRKRTVRLSELFGRRETLFVYSFMYHPGDDGPISTPCPVCTSIIDAVDGEVPHIETQIAFAVVAKAPIETFNAHARTRGWTHARLLSSPNTTFNSDYNAETPEQEQYAMATVFTKRDGAIHHFWSSELWYAEPEPGQNPRHVDFMWPLWGILDGTPGGRGSWMPDFAY